MLGDAEGWLGFSGWKEAGQSQEWRPEIMYGEEPVLTFVTIPHATPELAGSIFPKSTTLGALSLLRGASPTCRQTRLAFGGSKVYVVLRQVRGGAGDGWSACSPHGTV